MSRPWRPQRITPDDARFTEFAGVVNTQSRRDIGLKALYGGDNVVISDSKKIVRREGYTLHRAGPNVRSAYGCGNSLYVVDGTSLVHMTDNGDRLVCSGLAVANYCWDDINGDVYFTNGTDAGIVRGDAFLPWRWTPPALSGVAGVSVDESPATVLNMGDAYSHATFRICATYELDDGRETGPSEIVDIVLDPRTNLIRVGCTTGYARTNIYCTEPDGTVYRLVASGTGSAFTFNPKRSGRELTTLGAESLPTGVSHIAFLKGRCYAARYFQELNQTVVWSSQPLGFHLWNLANDFFAVPGEPGVLLGNNKGLLVGTTQAVYQYSEAGELETLVDYGVVPGTAGDTDAEGVAYFWTERGMCRAMPFENLTEKTVSMSPGARAVAAMIYLNGAQQFVTVTQGGGAAFNARKERT